MIGVVPKEQNPNYMVASTHIIEHRHSHLLVAGSATSESVCSLFPESFLISEVSAVCDTGLSSSSSAIKQRSAHRKCSYSGRGYSEDKLSLFTGRRQWARCLGHGLANTSL